MITGDTRPEPVEIWLGQNLGMSEKEGHLKILEDKLSLDFCLEEKPTKNWGIADLRRNLVFLPNNNWWCNQ